MKNLSIAIILLLLSVIPGKSQTANWRSFHSAQNDILYLNFGYDHGTTAQIGYSRAIRSFRPLLLNLEYSFPMGKDYFDDFKVNMGGQIELYDKGAFSVSTKLLANFRRYQSDLVRMVSFGSEFSLLTGYYKPGWHIGIEYGFDKSIITHIRHSELAKDNYRDIESGWFIPSGGHHFYGFHGSKTLSQNMNLTFRAGETNAQSDDEDSILPFYGQIGLELRF